MAAFPGLWSRTETPPERHTESLHQRLQDQADWEPNEQPRREPGELDDPALEEIRRSRERGDGKEREEAVVAQGEVAHRDDPVGVQSGQEPDEPPEEERGKQREDRLVPDGDPEIPGGGKHSESADGEDHLADVQRRTRDMDVREGLVE